MTGFLELHDMNVIVPNFIGFLFELAQLGLKLHYRDDYPGNNLLSSNEMDLNKPTLIHDMILNREDSTISL